MDELIKQEFDYSVIDEKDRDFMKGLAVEINTLANQGTEIFIKIGHALQRGKDRIAHGDFNTWVEQEFGINRRRASEYMRIASTFKCPDSGHLDKFDKTILLLLSAPSTPESARQEAIELAESGETLSIKEAKRIIEEHKAKIAELEAKPAQTQIVFRETEPADYQELKDKMNELATEKLALKASISQMKANHDNEIKKIASSGTSIPADYAELSKSKDSLTRDKESLISRIEQINSENENLSEKIKNLKKEQDSKISQAVTLRMKELQDEFDTKEKQLASVQARIDALQPEMNRLERKVGDLSVIREAEKEIRQHLMGISIVLGDLFSDIDIPDSSNKGLIALANEMEQGATAFKNFLNGIKHIGEYHE